jgi:hypothetical protein
MNQLTGIFVDNVRVSFREEFLVACHETVNSLSHEKSFRGEIRRIDDL